MQWLLANFFFTNLFLFFLYKKGFKRDYMFGTINIIKQPYSYGSLSTLNFFAYRVSMNVRSEISKHYELHQLHAIIKLCWIPNNGLVSFDPRVKLWRCFLRLWKVLATCVINITCVPQQHSSISFHFLGELCIFYSVFYIILALLFAICMQVLMWSLDAKSPRWRLEESRIGNNPGLGFRPMPTNISQGSLVWIDRKKITTSSYISKIDEFLKRKLIEIAKISKRFFENRSFFEPAINNNIGPKSGFFYS